MWLIGKRNRLLADRKMVPLTRGQVSYRPTGDIVGSIAITRRDFGEASDVSAWRRI